MNILMILTNSFDPDPRVLKEAKALINNSHKVTILAWDRDNRYKCEEEHIDGIKVLRLFIPSNYGSGLKQVIPFIKFCISAKKKSKDIKYDVIHAHDIDGIIAAMIINNKKKIIWDMHEFYDGFNYSLIKRKLYECLARIAFRKAFAIIYVVESQMRRYSSKTKNNAIQKVIMNCPEERTFLNFKRLKSNKLRISFIGSVREYDTLKIMMDQIEKYNNVQFYIHGTGIKFNEIKQLSKKYKNTIVTGKFNYSELKKLYENTDIVYSVYDSTVLNVKEAFPVKVFESIITKTPVIVSKDTFIGNFVEMHDIGFTIDERSSDDLDSLLKLLIENRNIIENKSKNIEKISHNFTWEYQVQALLDLYKEIK